MLSRKISRVAWTLAFVAAGLVPCWAEPGDEAKAQVFTRGMPDGARLTFSWDSHERVPFDITRRDNQVILHFDEPVALRWGGALKAVHPYIRQVETRNGGNTVILTLSEPSKARYFQNDGPRAVDNGSSGVDLTALPEAEPIHVAASEEEDSEPPVQRHVRHAAAKSRHKHLKKMQEAKTVLPTKISAAQEIAGLANLAPSAGTAASSAPAAASVPVIAPVPPPSAAPAVPMPAAAINLPAPVPVQEAIIPLPFKDDEAFAVFVWQKNLWIVSDSATPPLAEDLRKAGAPFVKEVRNIPDPHATIMYMPLEGDVSASVEKAPPDRVHILLARGPARLARNIALSFSASPAAPASITLSAGKADHDFAFSNPLTGDRISVIPMNEVGAGIASVRTFIDFSLLQSAQGIAVQDFSDKVSVALDKGKVVITAPGGLTLSPEAMEQMQESQSEAMLSRIPPTLFPYARWRLEDEKNFVPAQIRLLHDIVFEPPVSSDKARLKLLDLYLAEGLFPEALGMSNDILRSSLKFYQENKVSALRGAAYLFMYRIHEAARDFSVPELQNDPEARMLYDLCQELLGDDKQPFDFSANYDRYISHYPPSFIQKLAIIAADRNINRKNYAGAVAILDALKHDNYDEPVKKYADYMRAKIFSETHEEAEAAKIWETQAKDLDDPLIRARAEFSLINMLLKSDKITHDEAARRLEQLRIVWRGDSLEVGILTLLGNLYVQDKQYDKALHTMRDIVLYYPEVPEAVTTAKQMEGIFVMLYNKGAADTMPPLEALSLFYEFRDLVPLGKDGDQMIRNLADRLVNLDLLSRAAVLLDHQIRNRLVGEERSRIAAELAHIYLLNHQPDEALDILRTTGYGDLPADLQLQRLRLTAQALAQQGKPDKAIEVISSDNSPEGTLLRLSIYWDNKDWVNVVSIAEDMLGNRTDPGAPLTVPESEVLLKLATAYVYEHDSGQLQYLRDYFTPLMKNNPNRDNFRFITSESGAVDYDNLANLDQDIGAVKSYLDKAQDKPGKNGFSKAAN
jgi:tetratricopeptide (TPR) repeat protein